MKIRQNIYNIVAIVFMMDQFIKILIQRNMELYKEIIMIPNFFSLYYVKNTGAAFSILEDATLLLIVISVVFILLIDRTIKKEEKNLDKLSIISIGIILGGIFGNLMDRILYHSVIDYLSFSFGKYHFPVFNLADIGITIGVFLLLIDMVKEKKNKTKGGDKNDK